jgi:hypothetical protein
MREMPRFCSLYWRMVQGTGAALPICRTLLLRSAGAGSITWEPISFSRTGAPSGFAVHLSGLVPSERTRRVCVGSRGRLVTKPPKQNQILRSSLAELAADFLTQCHVHCYQPSRK